ncbi:hypothetical protein QYE76_070159 [Lolium multiflorum]|uniref:Integrase catalytic domain-containing protein n=1 Tax=Lolium multiflorum TaxID=4521 RepID=A0AAD8WFL3_LOLMU|nr:hypothetical protein QYE76_070159 [Lolium multiflorum]
MLEDCFKYYKGCQACQMFGKIQMVPASAMNPIIKPWPFRGWGMDMIGKIHPASSKGHEWILAITDYFTKWVEAVPMKKVKSEDVIKFVKEHVIHRFGIPQTITTDGGSVFISKEFRKFCDDMGIKLIRSSPYYAQANGQAEASNQSLIKLIKRKIDENPRVWHETLSEALWAYRMSCHGAIKTSPYQLVYGQEAVLPWEITAGSRRVTFQNDLTAEEYAALMSDTIESNRLLHEVHEGACGTHQSAHKMKWLIRRSGFYWPTMLEDCFKYYKGCQACQMFGKIQMVPASAMNPIIKPWPFRGWGMDMIGKIHPASSKGHEWILAITDYFTKWVEVVPMKKVKSEDVIKFVKEHVIHRFGIPQTITTDGGSVFISKEFRKFCDDMGIKLIRSSPYYAQANGQAEASNQSLIKLIKRKIDENPRVWHETLSEALWAYRMSCHGAIKTSPYQLVYGQEAVLPWEITAGSRRVTFQNDLTAEEYAALMSDTIEDATELRLWSLEKIKENKARVARAYNKKVRPKEFQVGDLVWEAVLPLGTKDKAYGKWSPNWHGPYKVVQVLKGNAYMLEQLDGAKFPVAVNGQHLKKYFPSMWDDEQ